MSGARAPGAPFIVGLTGGIGSGKSAVTERFAALGASVVDTDVISHQLTASGGGAIAALREAFGNDIIAADGALDRAAMRTRVFADSQVRARLEGILHPLIQARTLRECATAQGPYVVLAVPLLVESGFHLDRVQRVCVVDCPVEVQVARVRARNGWSDEQIRAVLASQASRAERLAAADDVIDNSTTLAALDDQVSRLHAHYLALAGTP